MGIVIRVFIEGIPRPQGSKQTFRRGNRIVLVESSKHLPEWRRRLVSVLQEHTGDYTPPKPAHVTLTFLMPRPKAHYDTKGHVKERFKHAAHTPRPDLDKLTRAVFDALTIAGIVEDDSHITSAVIAKRYADSPENTGVCITVEA